MMMEQPAAAARGSRLGRYITVGDSIMVRVPGAKQVNFPDCRSGRISAKELRDKLIAEQGLRVNGPTRRYKKPKPRAPTVNVEELGLPDGVTYCSEVRNGKEYYRYTVRWSEGEGARRKGKVKTFAIIKRGRDVARAMAIEHRRVMLEKHYHQDLG